MSAIGRWCFHRRFTVIAAWVLVLAGLGMLSQAVHSVYNNSFSLPGTGSTTAQELLARTIPAQAGDADQIVWQVSHGTVRDRRVMARVSSMLRTVATMPEVAGVVSPYRPDGGAQISRNGRIAYAVVNFTKQSNDIATADITAVMDAAEAARAPGLDIQLDGDAIRNTEQPSVGFTSVIGVIAAGQHGVRRTARHPGPGGQLP
jgi:putative drug exporter of the RND superfamily